VLARDLEDGEKRLVGYVVPESGELDLAALRAHTRSRLPDYMVPAAFVILKALPLTANGKLDRAAMPAPDFDRRPASRAPETAVHQVLCEIFSSVLGVPEVGIDDSFFDLGGQSLQAMRLLNQIRARTGVEILVNVLFDAPTVAELATFLDAKRTTAA
jgi:acyl carrier protein